jgi:hypothetical protein
LIENDFHEPAPFRFEQRLVAPHTRTGTAHQNKPRPAGDRSPGLRGPVSLEIPPHERIIAFGDLPKCMYNRTQWNVCKHFYAILF